MKGRKKHGSIGSDSTIDERTGRPKRIPLNTRDVLTAPTRKGYVRRFVNDIPGRIQKFKDAGYEIVMENIPTGDPQAGEAHPVGTAVSKPVGLGTTAVLMEIPEAYYNEDQQERQDAITQQEAGIRRSMNKNPDKDGQYGEVKIQHGQ